tara:strand:+ start:2264 stop:3448 length:1185 start_codon:yes stop_codon:yes gene_type:complete
MKLELWNIDKPIPYINNARKINQEAVDKVAASLKEFGWQQPIVVDSSNTIIVGHTRLKAARKLGYKEVPVHIAKDLSKNQVKAYRLADNRTGEYTDWDEALLSIEIKELLEQNVDLDLTGFKDKEIQTILNNSIDDFEGLTNADDIASDIPAVASKGDVFELGRHKLICGDATNEKDYTVLFGNVKADLLLTDPPYNVDYTGKTKDALKIKNDKFSDDSFHDFLTNSFSLSADKIKKGGSFYIFHADSEGYNFRSACRKADLVIKQCLVWIKDTMVMGRQDYHWQHEPILYGWITGDAHRWYSDRKQTTVLNFTRPKRSTEHPTMKPVSIIKYLINNSCKQEDIVFDPFAGSGSTLIACETVNRTFYGIELDPHYCDVIIKRYEDYTGNKVKKL